MHAEIVMLGCSATACLGLDVSIFLRKFLGFSCHNSISTTFIAAISLRPRVIFFRILLLFMNCWKIWLVVVTMPWHFLPQNLIYLPVLFQLSHFIDINDCHDLSPICIAKQLFGNASRIIYVSVNLTALVWFMGEKSHWSFQQASSSALFWVRVGNTDLCSLAREPFNL